MGKQSQKKNTNVKRTDKSSADNRSVNQGQGPDFQTQDPKVRKRNTAIEEEQDEHTGDERELPSKEKEEIPYIGDNPEETKKESPKLNG